MSQRFLCWMDALYVAAVWLSGAAITLMSLIIPWGVFSPVSYTHLTLPTILLV